MKKVCKKYDVGVIIGRFQINDLHEAHLDLIDSVFKEHNKVLVFLGVAPTFGQPENALPYEARLHMVLDKFPEAIIQPIEDNPSDEVWSKNLDKKIKSVLTPGQSVVLYGSRDSFIKRYSGCFATQELEAETKISASQIRESISKKVLKSSLFRAGVIWLAYNLYPTIYHTVDMAVVDKKNRKVLLGKKPGEKRWRFPGGFTDPSNMSDEEDAARELDEETCLTPGIENFHYIGSTNIDDWRYRNTRNKIRTSFFYVNYTFGVAKASDDLEEVKWFDLDNLTSEDFVLSHVPLFNMLEKYLKG